MKDKYGYDLKLIFICDIWPETLEFNKDFREKMENNRTKFLTYLATGYKVYSAVALCTNEAAGVQYILRKKIKKQ